MGAKLRFFRKKTIQTTTISKNKTLDFLQLQKKCLNLQPRIMHVNE